MNRDTTVLIADDSIVVRSVVRAHLESEGYRVVDAEDGAAAVEQCLHVLPDVVLLDVEMPELDGHQVLAQLKADASTRDVPVVFLTGRIGLGDVVAGLRGGAHDYLRKPFEPEELLARVSAASRLKKVQDELRSRNAELELVSRTDMLTGLANRRHLEELLTRFEGLARRSKTDLGVLLLDIDRFKSVNDTFGHAAGDRVLCEFADLLRDELRIGDVAGRWGGEEFLVILPGADPSQAMHVAERIRRELADRPVPHAGELISVTVSGGCVAGPPTTPESLVQAADALLYEAKNNGRNRIVASAISPVPR